MLAKAVLLSALTVIIAADLSPARTFECLSDGRCQALLPGTQTGFSFEHCRLICDVDGSLWPKVRSFSRRSNTTLFVDLSGTVQQLNFSSLSVPLLNRIGDVFKQNLQTFFGSKPANINGKPLKVTIRNLLNPDLRKVSLNVNESYALFISCDSDSATATLSAETVFGIRHALETLTQLIIYDDVQRGVRVACDVDIQDSPAFPYRGLSMDTVRHWYPIEALKKLIDGMAMNKLNRFHWHITDSQAFPVEMRTWPNLTYFGAYNPSSVYSQEDVRGLVDYALVRGLQVIPELDVPSHVGHGWDPEWTVPAGLGRMMLCFSKKVTGAPIGYMNPINPASYQVINDIYSELYNMSDQPDLIHIGGDEVSTRCWLNDKEILQWMLDHNYTQNTLGAAKLWLDFEANVQNIVKQISNNSAMPILWTSTLTGDYKKLLKDKLGTDNIAIEVWESSESSAIPDLLDLGFKVIVSNYDAWYFDCGYGQWVSEANNWCSPYKYWQLMYNNRPYKSIHGDWKITDPEKRKLILGGEGGVWSETIDAGSLGSKVWPRLAAVAERLWSDPEHCWYFANGRMQFHHYRMADRGIQADPVQPYWCSMYEGDCLVDPSTYSQHGWDTTCEEFQVPTTKTTKMSTSITTNTSTRTIASTTITTQRTSSAGALRGFERRIGWTFIVLTVLTMFYAELYVLLNFS